MRSHAEAGAANAQLELGKAYAIGVGVPRDDAEALRWYQKAADQGSAEARFLVTLRSSSVIGAARPLTPQQKALRSELDRRIRRNDELLSTLRDPMIELTQIAVVQSGDDVSIRGKGRDGGSSVLPSLKNHATIGGETDGVPVTPTNTSLTCPQ